MFSSKSVYWLTFTAAPSTAILFENYNVIWPSSLTVWGKWLTAIDPCQQLLATHPFDKHSNITQEDQFNIVEYMQQWQRAPELCKLNQGLIPFFHSLFPPAKSQDFTNHLPGRFFESFCMFFRFVTSIAMSSLEFSVTLWLVLPLYIHFTVKPVKNAIMHARIYFQEIVHVDTPTWPHPQNIKHILRKCDFWLGHLQEIVFSWKCCCVTFTWLFTSNKFLCIQKTSSCWIKC